MATPINISGLLLHAHPDRAEALCIRLLQMPGLEVHAISPEGHLIVTLENTSDSALADIRTPKASRRAIRARPIRSPSMSSSNSFRRIPWTMGFNQHTRGTWVNNMIYNMHLLVGKIAQPGNGLFSLTGQPSACGTAREADRSRIACRPTWS